MVNHVNSGFTGRGSEASQWFEDYCRLGFMNPYYVTGPHGLVISSSFTEILDQLQGPRRLDLVGVVEIISRYHLFGDRTLVEGIRRTPWMARPSSDSSSWEIADIPPHGKNQAPCESVASELFRLLCDEALHSVGSARTVGILLSGGMDSRVAAAVLDHLSRTGQLRAQVTALTWGIEESRDVQYAKRVASCLRWDWEHLPLSPEDLERNLTEAALRGCEYSPIHLHAMPRVRDMEGLDCIVAASFGDGVGRGEYSGKHIEQLEPLSARMGNWFSLLDQGAYRDTMAQVEVDLRDYRATYHREEPLQQLEIEQQAHYLRRMLNPCMAVINEKIRLIQLFSSPRVFGYMWSLAPSVRNDRVYRALLEMFAPHLLGIPWARTGRPYLDTSADGDHLSQLHNRYGRWIRQELHPLLMDRCLSDGLARLGVFNMDAIESCLYWNRRLGRGDRASKLDELLLWLASLAECIAMHNISTPSAQGRRRSQLQSRAMASLQVAGYYLARPAWQRVRRHAYHYYRLLARR
jgi:hypothetical protein